MSEEQLSGLSPDVEPAQDRCQEPLPNGKNGSTRVAEPAAGDVTEPPDPRVRPAELTDETDFEQDHSDDPNPGLPGDEPGSPGAVASAENGPPKPPRLSGVGGRRQRVLTRKKDVGGMHGVAPENLTPAQRLLLLDTWQRSGLPAGDFAAMVGISKHRLYAWKWKFEREVPGGLVDRPRGGPKGSQLPELTKRTILMLKQANPEWGCQRISDMLLRGPALPASPSAVARVLIEAGYELKEEPNRPGRIPITCGTSSGNRPTSSGRPTCPPSSSSGKTGACTWWRLWMTTAASSLATDCTPVNRAPRVRSKNEGGISVEFHEPKTQPAIP